MRPTGGAPRGRRRLLGVTLAALAVACDQRTGSVLVRLLAPADVTRIRLEVQPANAVRDLTAAEYDPATGAFTAALAVPAGVHTVSASAYAGATLVGTASAPVTVAAGTTATVHLTIIDSRPPPPPPDRAPIITDFVVPVATLLVGTSMTVSAAATDLDGDPIAFAWTAAPNGCGTFANGGEATTPFTARAVGPCTLTITASANGKADTASRSVSVSALTIHGRLTYDRVPPTANGLDYAATVAMPIRGATVELLDASTILATTTSDDAGAYAFSWGGPSSVRVRVAAMTSAPVIRVEDNTGADALYAMVSQEVDGATTASLDLHAASGWGGAGYTGTRVAAPFAVLDTAYAAARTFLAERAVAFPELRINWSASNRPEPGDKALGQIGTTHWDGSELYLLGLADGDTDEFDSHVIVHEWAHYFESKLSRADNPRGIHDFGEAEDPRTSWGEGWATALGAIVLHPDDVYADTLGPRQGTTAIRVSAEDNGDADPSPGWFSEGSMMHVFYDLWDPPSAAEPFDAVSFGIGALCDVMTGLQRDTDALTTVFSFVAGLIARAPSSAAAVDALLAHRGVAAPIRDEFGRGETHGGGIAGALPVYNVLAVGEPAITLTFTPDANIFTSLGQNRLATFSGNGSPVTLSASSANHDPLVVALYERGVLRARAGGCGAGGPAEVAGFPTTSGGIYAVVITGCNTVGPGTYSATVSLASP